MLLLGFLVSTIRSAWSAHCTLCNLTSTDTTGSSKTSYNSGCYLIFQSDLSSIGPSIQRKTRCSKIYEMNENNLLECFCYCSTFIGKELHKSDDRGIKPSCVLFVILASGRPSKNSYSRRKSVVELYSLLGPWPVMLSCPWSYYYWYITVNFLPLLFLTYLFYWEKLVVDHQVLNPPLPFLNYLFLMALVFVSMNFVRFLFMEHNIGTHL